MMKTVREGGERLDRYLGRGRWSRPQLVGDPIRWKTEVMGIGIEQEIIGTGKYTPSSRRADVFRWIHPASGGWRRS